MNQNLSFKTLFVIFLIAWALWELNPPTGQNLIDYIEAKATNTDEDFKTLITQAREKAESEAMTPYGAILDSLSEDQSLVTYFPNLKKAIGLSKEPNRTALNKLQEKAAGKIKLGLDLQGGTEFRVRLDTSNIDESRDVSGLVDQAIEILRKRVDRFGVAEPVIMPEGESRIRIQLPGLSEATKESARNQIQQAAFLEFRMVHPDSATLASKGLLAPGYEDLKLEREDEDGNVFTQSLLVKINDKSADAENLTGKNVRRAYVARHQVTNRPEIHLEFDSEGALLFKDITTENVGRQFAIVLDGELYSAPVINEPIPSGRCSISGGFSVREAYELANILENPLETPVEIVEERGVDPSLGKDSIQSGVKATIIGMVSVAGFMLIYYFMAGMVANVALVLNIIFLLGALSVMDATLTLPGIAGIVLTIGMAVDANVLIFERIREELALGKSLRGSISAGYDKAFSTILDANVTTLIASTILMYMGSGPVKGFGVTLTTGVIISMFTALFVTRLVFDALLKYNVISGIKMLQLLKSTNIDFFKFSKQAFIVSWVLIIAGCGYGAMRGGDVLGVDFAGGDSLTLKFEERVGVDQIRAEVEKMEVGSPMIQYQKDVSSGNETLQITTEFETGEKVEQALKAAFPSSEFFRIKLDVVGPSVGNEILISAVVSTFLALFGILVYVAFRYEFSFSIGAVIAVVHDVLMTLGWFFLTGRELSAPMVAAVLTIIGFSMNDTIVIFDRIREDLQSGARGTFREIINHALNKTLSRTVITSGTSLLAALSLYIFGGGVINDFAFTFVIGIITGTYSSIYIAANIVHWWNKGQRPEIHSTFIAEEEGKAASVAQV